MWLEVWTSIDSSSLIVIETLVSLPSSSILKGPSVVQIYRDWDIIHASWGISEVVAVRLLLLWALKIILAKVPLKGVIEVLKSSKCPFIESSEHKLSSGDLDVIIPLLF